MNSNSKTARLEETIQQLRTQLTHSQQRTDSLIQILLAYERKHKCEALYAEDRTIDAGASLLEIINIVNVNEEVRANNLIMDWLATFKSQCVSSLERLGDEALRAEKRDEAVEAYSMALSLDPSTSNTLLTKWAGVMLIRSSVSEVFSATAKFGLSSFLVYQVLCEVLQEGGRILEAVECFRQMQSELGEQTQLNSGDEIEWVANFRERCLHALEQYGDDAMVSASYKDAVVHYTAALALGPLSTNLLAKRSGARAGIGSWKESLEDADAAINLDPSFPRGYERKHAALLGARRYDEAIDAYQDMLLTLEQSPDPAIRELRNSYVSPSQTMAAIRSSVKRTQRDTPLILINTETGRLRDQWERISEFEADPKFKELVASMTTVLDDSRITQIVRQYFRYATLSHTWEGAEPLFHEVLQESVHKLAKSSTVLKLVMFCRTVQEAGLRWAWSDTCCINKMDSSVLQESLTSMFQWYHDSALMIVHLKGVRSNSELRALIKSFWNTRAWTLQEFFASRVIRFYTEDWTPYLPQESAYNHKVSSAIMSEMAVATGVDAEVLRSLQPGPGNVRQKLCLAAARAATRPEDMAYSLFGIFDVSFQILYGEGQQYALGRLLQEVLTRSGDVTILAWTGKASDYNSCLPAEIAVYRESASYIPLPIEDGEMDALIAKLRTDPAYFDSALILYDRLVHLPSPRLFYRRLSLPCIVFPLKGLSLSSPGSPHTYHATTSAFGSIEIKTMEDLSSQLNLVLVHPWLQYLFDLDLPSEDMDHDTESLTSADEDDEDGENDNFDAHPSPTYDKLSRALRLFAHLQRPFGALLLAPVSHMEYKRVASDHPIIVRLLREISPHYLAQRVRTLDIL